MNGDLSQVGPIDTHVRDPKGQCNLNCPSPTTVVDDVLRWISFGDEFAKCGIRQLDLAWLVPGEVEDADPFVTIVCLSSLLEFLQGPEGPIHKLMLFLGAKTPLCAQPPILGLGQVGDCTVKRLPRAGRYFRVKLHVPALIPPRMSRKFAKRFHCSVVEATAASPVLHVTRPASARRRPISRRPRIRRAPVTGRRRRPRTRRGRGRRRPRGRAP